jgi:hypothetical protein
VATDEAGDLIGTASLYRMLAVAKIDLVSGPWGPPVPSAKISPSRRRNSNPRIATFGWRPRIRLNGIINLLEIG